MLRPDRGGPPGSVTELAAIPGLSELWATTVGDPRICIAVLDGPVDREHPSFRGANLTEIETLASDVAVSGPSIEHGTHIASILFGQHDGPVKGIAPQCRGLIVPIFRDVVEGSPVPCSQVDLARAIVQATEEVRTSSMSAAGSFHLRARLIPSWLMRSRPVRRAACSSWPRRATRGAIACIFRGHCLPSSRSGR